MNIDELLSRKEELSRKVADLLHEFEAHAGVAISEIRFVRREEYNELGQEIGSKYIVECNCKL